jgi:hypothetical protein
MKWKAAIVGPTDEVYRDTAAFRLLYSFPTREEAEAYAACFRFVETNIIVECEEPEKLADDSVSQTD